MHVLNEIGMKFYQACGFKIDERLDNYYTDLEEPHCYILLKEISHEKKDEKKEEKKEWFESLTQLVRQIYLNFYVLWLKY